MKTEVDFSNYVWPGLAPYKESDNHLFFGRTGEISNFCRKITSSKLIILYGPSGAGKTSLLQAGIFPVLREKNILPVPIRIEFPAQNQALKPVIEQIGPALEQECINYGINLTYQSSPLLGARMNQLTLWEWLRMFYLTGHDHELWQPLFVFDQFEEFFTIGKQAKGIEEFVQQLGDAAENFLPRELNQILNNSEEELSQTNLDQNYKFLFSIREDYFAQLQDLRNVLPDVTVRQNYFALGRLNGNQAFQAVIGPAPKGVISERVAYEIVKFVAKTSESGEQEIVDTGLNLDQLVVEPSILSLVCQQLYSKSMAGGQKAITLDFVMQTKEKILQDFYDSIMSEVEQETRNFVEDNLLDAEGFRTSEPESNFKSQQINPHDIQILINQRILHHIEQYGRSNFELSHDVLAPVVKKSRESRQFLEEEIKRKKEIALLRTQRKRRNIVFAGLIALLVLFAVLTIWALKERNKAKTQSLFAEHQKNEALIANQLAEESKKDAIAQKTIALENEKKADDAKILALNAKTLAENELYQNIKNSLSVSAEKMNVLYHGIWNPIKITVSGIPDEKLRVSIDNGRIQKDSLSDPFYSGEYLALPNDFKPTNINVYGEIKPGKIEFIGSKNFRVKSLQVPYVSFAGKTSGIILKETLLKTEGLTVNLDMDFDRKFIINGFTILIAAGGYDFEQKSKSSSFTTSQLDLIQRIRHDGNLIFKDITVIDPEQHVLDLPPCIFKVYENQSVINSKDDVKIRTTALDFFNAAIIEQSDEKELFLKKSIESFDSIKEREVDDLINEIYALTEYWKIIIQKPIRTMDPQRLIEEKILNIENKILTCDLHPNDIDSLSILQNLQFVFGFNNLSFKSFGLAEFLLQLTNRLLVVPEISIKQKEAISTFCSELGWHFLINKGDFKYLLEFYLNAQRADSTNQDTRSMIPLCYVLNNMYPEAEKEYLNLKDIPWTNDEDYATFRDKFLDLIDDCEKLYGISHPDFEKVRELLLK